MYVLLSVQYLVYKLVIDYSALAIQSLCVISASYIYVCACVLGSDLRSESCQRFFREGLTTSFTKILTDEAVSGWKYEIHVSTDFDPVLCFDRPDK